MRSRTLALLAGLVALGTGVQAQTRLRVEPRSSLAWWQVNPHLNHLWATTCPEEPSWRPGEGRSGGWAFDRALKPPKQGYAGVSDTTIIPVYPRGPATPVCIEAVAGEVVVQDTVQWRGVRGQITVEGEKLITGEDRRDNYTHNAILNVDRYPEITFTIDSVVNVTKGDTLTGTAVGVLHLHGVRKPMTAAVRAWPEGGALRVTAKFHVPARSLTGEWGLSKFALGLVQLGLGFLPVLFGASLAGVDGARFKV